MGPAHHTARSPDRGQAPRLEPAALGEGRPSRHAQVRAIVGAARLDAPDLDAVLDGHEEASSRFRGVRDMVARHPDPAIVDWARLCAGMQDADWRAGSARLGQHGLSSTRGDTTTNSPLFIVWRPRSADPLRPVPPSCPVGIGGPFGGRSGDSDHRARTEEEWRESFARSCELDHGWTRSPVPSCRSSATAPRSETAPCREASS